MQRLAAHWDSGLTGRVVIGCGGGLAALLLFCILCRMLSLFFSTLG